MKIAYIDFWEGINPENFWFSTYLKQRYKKEFVFGFDVENADIIIGSCFGKNILNHKKNKAIKIFYTGENVRPDLINYDFSISFDYEEFGGRNIRVPLWYLYIDWWGVGGEYAINFNEFHRKFDPEDIYKRENFCCIMIGNPVKNRLDVTRELNTYKKVDGYGTVFSNKFTGRKLELLQNYRFNICFENVARDGYHTEKLVEAKMAGCIPIYYGAETASLDFNKYAFINYKDFNSPFELLKYIKEIEENKNKFIQICSEPLFNSPPRLTKLDNFFDKFIN